MRFRHGTPNSVCCVKIGPIDLEISRGRTPYSTGTGDSGDLFERAVPLAFGITASCISSNCYALWAEPCALGEETLVRVLSCECALTRVLLEGGNILPLPFSAIFPEVLGVSPRNVAHLIRHKSTQTDQKSLSINKSVVNDVRVMPCSANFDQK